MLEICINKYLTQGLLTVWTLVAVRFWNLSQKRDIFDIRSAFWVLILLSLSFIMSHMNLTSALPVVTFRMILSSLFLSCTGIWKIINYREQITWFFPCLFNKLLIINYICTFSSSIFNPFFNFVQLKEYLKHENSRPNPALDEDIFPRQWVRFDIVDAQVENDHQTNKPFSTCFQSVDYAIVVAFNFIVYVFSRIGFRKRQGSLWRTQVHIAKFTNMHGQKCNLYFMN